MSVYQKSSRSEILSNFGRKVASYLKTGPTSRVMASNHLLPVYVTNPATISNQMVRDPHEWKWNINTVNIIFSLYTYETKSTLYTLQRVLQTVPSPIVWRYCHKSWTDITPMCTEFHKRQPTVYCQLPTVNCLLSTAYCQLLTFNCLMLTATVYW
jgi:hypothetical protein